MRKQQIIQIGIIDNHTHAETKQQTDWRNDKSRRKDGLMNRYWSKKLLIFRFSLEFREPDTTPQERFKKCGHDCQGGRLTRHECHTIIKSAFHAKSN